MSGHLQVSDPLHFAAEFVLLVVMAGAMFQAVRVRGGPAGRYAMIQGAGFGVLAVAQVLHGSHALADDPDRTLAVTRSIGYALLLFGARPSVVVQGTMAPAILLAGGRAPSWFVVPAALSALVAARGAVAHRTDQDPATFAFAGAFAAFAVGELATAFSGTNWSVVGHSVRALGAFLLARWLWTSVVRSIRLRFVAAFIAALVVLILVISTALTQVIASNIGREELVRVGISAQSEVDALTPIGQRAATAASTLAQTDLVRGQVSARDKKVLQQLAGDALKRVFQDLDFLVIVDGRGRKLATAASTPGNRSHIAAMPAEQAEAVAGSDLVACVLRLTGCPAGRPLSVGDTIDTAGPNTVVFMAASTVTRPGSSAPAGALALGYRLDHDFVQSIARRAGGGTGVSILHGGQVITTTFQADKARDGLARNAIGKIVRTAVDERGSRYATQTRIGSRDYFTAFAPLQRKIDGQTVAVLAFSRPATAARVTQAGIQGILFIVALVAAAIASLIASLVGARITRPIRALTNATQRVRGGDLHARADVESSDEVGALGAAFNQMTGSLDQLTGDLRRAAEEEAALRAQMEAIMQSMGDGLIATDAGGKVVAFNRAAERIVGRDARKALGKNIADLLRSANGTNIADVALGAGGEVELARDGGGRIPVALTSAPLRDAAGRPGGRVVVFRDVSREAEAERMKTEFLSNVSHELRTPLTPIKGYTEILKRKQFPRQKALGFLEGILESTSRLERIVEILVDFAAMEAGRLKARTEPLDMRMFSEGLIKKWKSRDNAHMFVVKVPAALPAAQADPRLLSKCVDELIDNAVKFSPPKGKTRPRVEIDAQLVRSGGRRRLRLSIRDFGIGISPEQMPSIFQDFRQLDGSETRPFGGLGLGLAYARRVAEVHQGDIQVESTPGKGSIFSLLLPVAEKKSRGPARARKVR